MSEELKQAIRNWLKFHRPDVIPHMEPLLANSKSEELKPVIFAMQIAFAAGRRAQALNPTIPYEEVLESSVITNIKL